MKAAPSAESVRALIRALGRELRATMPNADMVNIHFHFGDMDWTLSYEESGDIEGDEDETIVEGNL